LNLVRTLRIVLIVIGVLGAVVSAWWVWHVRTVRHATLIAPATIVPQPRARLTHPIDVWIDTDPSCGASARRDVDDCWAIAAALRSPAIRIRGISTSFGNTDVATATQIARDVVTRFGASGIEIVEGADAPDAIARALHEKPLTILSLAPATNVAALLQRYPQLAPRIDAVIAVAGSTPDVGLFPVGDRHILHAHDQNFRRDVGAFRTLLDSRRPLVLIPYATATQFTITASDLDAYARRDEAWKWLANQSRGWQRYWSLISGEEGFWPFDAVAVAYLIEPRNFRCVDVPAQIRRELPHAPHQFLHVSRGFDRGWIVTYCGAIADPAQARSILNAKQP
jgi:inosine-uridine nucleoside N-ribohydrolase